MEEGVGGLLRLEYCLNRLLRKGWGRKGAREGGREGEERVFERKGKRSKGK